MARLYNDTQNEDISIDTDIDTAIDNDVGVGDFNGGFIIEVDRPKLNL